MLFLCVIVRFLVVLVLFAIFAFCLFLMWRFFLCLSLFLLAFSFRFLSFSIRLSFVFLLFDETHLLLTLFEIIVKFFFLLCFIGGMLLPFILYALCALRF